VREQVRSKLSAARRREDRQDIEAARRALAESKGRRIPYAKVRKKLGLA
jgi:hypothetical protein